MNCQWLTSNPKVLFWLACSQQSTCKYERTELIKMLELEREALCHLSTVWCGKVVQHWNGNSAGERVRSRSRTGHWQQEVTITPWNCLWRIIAHSGQVSSWQVTHLSCTLILHLQLLFLPASPFTSFVSFSKQSDPQNWPEQSRPHRKTNAEKWAYREEGSESSFIWETRVSEVPLHWDNTASLIHKTFSWIHSMERIFSDCNKTIADYKVFPPTGS